MITNDLVLSFMVKYPNIRNTLLQNSIENPFTSNNFRQVLLFLFEEFPSISSCMTITAYPLTHNHHKATSGDKSA